MMSGISCKNTSIKIIKRRERKREREVREAGRKK